MDIGVTIHILNHLTEDNNIRSRQHQTYIHSRTNIDIQYIHSTVASFTLPSVAKKRKKKKLIKSWRRWGHFWTQNIMCLRS